MSKKKSFLFIILLLLLSFTVPHLTYAQDENVDYSVQAHLPDNQLDTKQTYFDLRVKPKQSQQLEVEIFNNEQEAITVHTDIYNASTNRNGLIVYEEQEEISDSLDVPLSDILTLEDEEVEVPAGESRKVSAELEMPEESFDGIILGGFYFEKDTEEEAENEGVNIDNKYSYVIGVQLSQNDDDVEPELSLESVTPELTDYRTSVVATIQNKQPVIMEDLTIEAKVYEENEEKPIQEVKDNNFKMAPNSDLSYTIDWEDRSLEAGDYILHLTAEDKNDQWEWEEPFTIEKEEADEINKEAANVDKGNYTLWFILGIVVLFAIIAGLLLYIRKLKKDKTAEA